MSLLELLLWHACVITLLPQLRLHLYSMSISSSVSMCSLTKLMGTAKSALTP